MFNSRRFGSVLFLAPLLWSCGADEPGPDTCGDFTMSGVESCDDGNSISMDGCSATCQQEAGWRCVEGLPCFPLCGDSLQVGGETCDDGNLTDGDGCSAQCREEVPSSEVDCSDDTDNDGDGDIDCADMDCTGVSPCGATEICDDMVDNDGDGDIDCTDSDCRLEARCAGPVENCSDGIDNDGDELVDCADLDCECADPACGNDVLEEGEDCDEGADNSDTASDACRTNCTNPTCGDGVRDSGELCDDGDGNSATGACRTDCTVNLLTGCAAASGLEFYDVAELVGLQHFRLEGRITNSSGNSYAPPASCGVPNGVDTIVSVVAPLTANVAVRLDPALTTAPITLSRLNGCGTDALATECVQPSRFQSLIFSITEGEQYYILLDSAAPAGGRFALDVYVLNGVRSVGAECEPGDALAPCPSTYECYNAGEGNRCLPARTTPLPVDSECTDFLVDSPCDSGLACQSRRCTAIEGQTCDTPLEVGGLDAIRVGDVVGFDVEPAPFYELVAPSCFAGDSVTNVLVEAEQDGVLIVEATAAESSVVPGLSLREICDTRASEIACALGTETGTRLEAVVVDGGVYSLLVTGSGAVDIVASMLPLRSLGEACDPAGALDRCSVPLVCSADGTCESAVPGTCGAPTDVLEVGEGSLEERGVIVSTTLINPLSAHTGSCSPTDGIEQVFVLQPPGLGTIDLAWLSPPAGAALYARSTCIDGAESACSTISDGSILLKNVPVTDAPIYLFADTGSTSAPASAGVLTIRYLPSGLLGQPCTPEVGCRSEYMCMVPDGAFAFQCVWRPILPGQTCVIGEAPCVDTYECIDEVADDFRCVLVE